MMTHKGGEHKVFLYEGNRCRAIELSLVRGCDCWACNDLTVFVDDNYAGHVVH